MTEQQLDEALNEWTVQPPPERLRAKTLAAYRQQQGRPWIRWAVAAGFALAVVGLGARHFDFEPKIGATWAVLGDGTHIRTRTLVEPRIAFLKYFRWGGSTATAGNRQQRCVSNRAGGDFTCYETWIETQGDGRYRLSFFAHRPDEAALQRMGIAGYRDVAPFALPPPTVLAEGETVTVELRRPAPGDHIYDEITLSQGPFPDTPDKRPLAEGPYAADMLRIAAPRLSIDGVPVAESPVDARGVSVWFVLPGEGRWVLTTRPGKHTGFQQAGRAHGTLLEFEYGGRRYHIHCAEPVVPGRERQLYVLHEAQLAADHPFAGTRAAVFGSAGPPDLFE
jgi:hypothetical protein